MYLSYRNIRVLNSNFDKNLAESSGNNERSYGGAIAFARLTPTDQSQSNNILIYNSNFTNNVVYSSIYNTNDKPVESYGGAIYFATANNNITIDRCYFDNNTAKKGGNPDKAESMCGAVYFGGSSFSLITIKDTVFSRNSADGRFGVINFNNPVNDCNLINVTFKDNKGVARLQAKLDVGNYEVTSINPVTGQKVVKNLTIVKRIVENKDVPMDFDAGTYVVVRAIDDDGTPVGAGEVVSLKVNGISYVGVSNNIVYAKVKINLNPKKYTMTFQYRGYKTTSKLVVKQTMKLVKKTVKVKIGKKIVLKAKVKLSNGKAVKGKVIKFKFKGKYYKAKTNKKGIAKVTIKKKSVLKKLKKGKKYKYTAIYNKNKVSGKVKIIK